MQEAWLSIIGGGLAAAVLTIAFNALWDQRKQKLSEDWQFRRYHANMIHFATVGIVEAFFAGKTEFLFLTSVLATLAATLNQLTVQADAIVRQQGGPQLTIAELEQRKAQLLQPFQTFNQQQVNMRWYQYEQKAKDLQAKVEANLSALQPLIPAALHAQCTALYTALSQPFVWDLPHAEEKLRLFDEKLPELNRIRGELARLIEVKLGRK